MTITAQTPRSGPYNGDGGTVAFSYTFRVDDESELVVVVRDSSGVENVQTLTADYSVSGVGQQGGGTVTFTTAPSSSSTVTLYRDTARKQGVDLQNRKAVVPQVLEDSFDELTKMVQDLGEESGRSLKVQVSDAALAGDLTVGKLEADKAVLVNPQGDGFVMGPTADNIASAQGYADDAESALDEFTDLYLGKKSSDPATDNDGNSLQTGAVYFNTSSELIRVYNGTEFVNGTAPVSSFAATLLDDGSQEEAQQTLGTPVWKADVAALLADTGSYAEGTIIRTRAEGFAYRAVDTATAATVANASGQAFDVLKGADGTLNVTQFDIKDSSGDYEISPLVKKGNSATYLIPGDAREPTALADRWAPTILSETDVLDLRTNPVKHLSSINALGMDLGSLRNKNAKIVVTGDSLSFNRYDYHSSSYTGADMPAGTPSWSNLIRDAFLMNTIGWVPASEIFVHGAPGGTTVATGDIRLLGDANQASTYLNGARFQNQLEIDMAVGDEVVVEYMPTEYDVEFSRSVLFYTLNKAAVGAQYNIEWRKQDGTVLDNQIINTTGSNDQMPLRCVSNDINLSSLDYRAAPITVRIRKDSGTGPLYLVGFASRKFEFENTGVGGTTSQWLYDNRATILTNENPDLAFICVGANDKGSNFTFDETYDNVKSTIESVRATNPNCQFILIGPPPRDNVNHGNSYDDITGAADHHIYRRALNRVANNLNCGYLDVVSVFVNEANSFFHHDNIHYSRFGNQWLFDAIMKRFAPSVDTRCQTQGNIGNSLVPIVNLMERRKSYWREDIFRSRGNIEFDGSNFVYNHDNVAGDGRNNWWLSDRVQPSPGVTTSILGSTGTEIKIEHPYLPVTDQYVIPDITPIFTNTVTGHFFISERSKTNTETTYQIFQLTANGFENIVPENLPTGLTFRVHWQGA